ncbi:MAG: DUF433 domain-containing protein [Chloroflexi bacterium]|nr:DUF433 domain-containing protein [Chloroflexota bacterium]MCI0574808.1 DUF433 domain-containing protein [Chloroflexota bacterium]MCI0649829.1 DUF433 domain-containing protein [Chloroflexota bacterium]MCI0729126.1 DUF433 domain-containing protein [Chloroflexota bacterium]
MQLEDYFEFLDPDDIRIKGHRIGIDDVLYYYLEGYSAEEIAATFPSLSLEELYATLTYYHGHQAEIDAYLARLEAWREQRYQEAMANPSPPMKRLLNLKAR